MSDEVDRHVLRKYEIQQKLGKGVRARQSVVARAGRREVCVWVCACAGLRDRVEGH